MPLRFNDHLLPLRRGEAVGRGWTAATDGKPMGVTWHWAVTWDLAACRRVIGPGGLRRGEASAHFGVGRTRAEGIDRYVALENRSWHAGVAQTLRWDGRRSTARTKGARTCIGIETVHIGYARRNVPAGADWIPAAAPNGKAEYLIQPWPEEQIAMMIALGKHIVARFPHIRPQHHHGHHDLCPGYKLDVIGFPFARVLRGIYDDPSIPDVWTPYAGIAERQQALIDLGYDLGPWGADGDWGRMSDAALRKFQREAGLVEDGQWTSFVCRAAHAARGA